MNIFSIYFWPEPLNRVNFKLGGEVRVDKLAVSVIDKDAAIGTEVGILEEFPTTVALPLQLIIILVAKFVDGTEKKTWLQSVEFNYNASLQYLLLIGEREPEIFL